MSRRESAAATTASRPEVESLEDLWCWLNIWGDLLHKHQARTRPDLTLQRELNGITNSSLVFADPMEQLERFRLPEPPPAARARRRR